MFNVQAPPVLIDCPRQVRHDGVLSECRVHLCPSLTSAGETQLLA